MNLADMLCYADIQQLSSIADKYDCDCNGHSKNELIQSILSKVNRRDTLDLTISALQQPDIRFLHSIVFEVRDQFSLEDLLARASQACFDSDPPERSPREMIVEFKKRGWLFNGFSQQTKYLLQFPADLKRRVKDTMARSFGERLVFGDQPAAYRDEHELIVDDLAAMLHYIYHNEVVLTADGSLYKRHLLQLLNSLSVQEEPVGKVGWRFGYGRKFRDLPDRLSLMYDYCYHEGLIQELPGKLALTDKGMEAVLSGRRENLSQVYRFWVKLYKGPVPNLQALVYWIGRLADDWVSAGSLGVALCPLIRPFYYDSAESILERRLLRMMMHLGMLRIGEDEELGTTVAATKLGESLIGGTYIAEEEAIPVTIPQSLPQSFDNSVFH